MLSKAHIDSQKAHGRQLNAKVCDIESVIFVILSRFLSSLFNNTNSRLVRVLTVVFARTVHNTAHCCSFHVDATLALRPINDSSLVWERDYACVCVQH